MSLSLEEKLAEVEAQLEEQRSKFQAKSDATSQEIEELHKYYESRGINSRGTKDIFGKPFPVSVDSAHKATKVQLWRIYNPHMRALHVSWFAFMSAFFSTFAPAPLAVPIKESLKLERQDLANGATASITGNIMTRICMGWVCDKWGPRYAMAANMLVSCAPIIGIAFIQNSAGFIAMRFFIGCGLAAFVAAQAWTSNMFSKNCVGFANAVAAGWGNMGAGVTNLLMPFVFAGFLNVTGNDQNIAWRLSFILPLCLHVLSGLLALWAQDMPDGNIRTLELSGAKQKQDLRVLTKVGLCNTNTWILTLSYGYCFGVELTVDNVIASYYFEYFACNLELAGIFAAIFGLVNLVSRPSGGWVSDKLNKRFGVRGRIWGLFVAQLLSGVFCLVMGTVTLTHTAPDFGGPNNVTAYWRHTTGRGGGESNYWPITGEYVSTDPNCDVTASLPERRRLAGAVTGSYQCDECKCIIPGIIKCGVSRFKATEWFLKALEDPTGEIQAAIIDTVAIDGYIQVTEAPNELGGTGDGCTSLLDGGALAGSVVVMFIFSIFCHMACGLTYGIVPYVNKPATGVVAGLVGAGGAVGSVLTNVVLFTGNSTRTDEGFLWMGVWIIAVSATLVALHFPDQNGSMFTGPNCKFNPQLIKMPEGYDATAVNYQVDAAAQLAEAKAKKEAKKAAKKAKKEKSASRKAVAAEVSASEVAAAEEPK